MHWHFIIIVPIFIYTIYIIHIFSALALNGCLLKFYYFPSNIAAKTSSHYGPIFAAMISPYKGRCLRKGDTVRHSPPTYHTFTKRDKLVINIIVIQSVHKSLYLLYLTNFSKYFLFRSASLQKKRTIGGAFQRRMPNPLQSVHVNPTQNRLYQNRLVVFPGIFIYTQLMLTTIIMYTIIEGSWYDLCKQWPDNSGLNFRFNGPVYPRFFTLKN